MKTLNLTLDFNSFNSLMENKSISAEDKLVEVLKFEIKNNLINTLRDLYEKLTDDPIYRGDSTFENFAANLSHLEKYHVIQIIEKLCENDPFFDVVVKVDHSEINWSENYSDNARIKKEILG